MNYLNLMFPLPYKCPGYREIEISQFDCLEWTVESRANLSLGPVN